MLAVGNIQSFSIVAAFFFWATRLEAFKVSPPSLADLSSVLCKNFWVLAESKNCSFCVRTDWIDSQKAINREKTRPACTWHSCNATLWTFQMTAMTPGSSSVLLRDHVTSLIADSMDRKGSQLTEFGGIICQFYQWQFYIELARHLLCTHPRFTPLWNFEFELWIYHKKYNIYSTTYYISNNFTYS